MVFSSTTFLFIFLPLLLVVYFVAGTKYRNAILLLASLFFYAWGEPKYILLLIISILFNYVSGLLMDKIVSHKKLILIITLVYDLGMLFVFKYLNFTVEILRNTIGLNMEIQSLALPIGISFYTFQIMSYIIDVYKKNIPVQKNISKLALYIAFFPQLIAGPIVRYSDIEKQLSYRTTSVENIRKGMIMFAIGFSKKILIADQLAPLADNCFSMNYPSVFAYWTGAIAYTLQIYFDFSGYSNMAIGLGKIFGFDFPENFNFPYISQSIQEFWRRWHISLGSWFRDYLYIPLGGSRKGQKRTYFNYLMVFFLTGLWHGASFNFIVWGLYYAVFIILEKSVLRRLFEKLPKIIRHIYTLIIVTIGWVFFRADNLTHAINYIKGMFTVSGKDIINFIFVIDLRYIFLLVIGIAVSIPHKRLSSFFNVNAFRRFIYDIGIILLFILAIGCMYGSGYSPFLYFRF
ncbi:MAG: MBOAT family protein [Lachnospiraceae bacterium]|nr:MBOAT family protein [Lachnospiraceae bacterium]